MAWPSARAKTATVGGSWTPTDMNAVQDQYIRSTGILNDDLDPTTVLTKVGLSGAGVTRRSSATVATDETQLAGGSLADLATVGPSLTLTVVPGILKYVVISDIKQASNNFASAIISVTSGLALLARDPASVGGSAVTNTVAFTTVGNMGEVAVVTAGTITMKLVYSNPGPGTANFRNRVLMAACEGF